MVRLLPPAEAADGRGGHHVPEVNIEHDADAAPFVENANGGNRTVPTLRFADGSALTNPSLVEVAAKLDSLAA